jgi:ribonucleoside-diphosphate reductase alpha chain
VFFSEEEVRSATLAYFKEDELAMQVWMDKYALKDKEGRFLEKTPDDMHRRLAKEFARIEQKYPNPISEEEIYELFKDFRYVCPQGSPMYGVGNPYVLTSLSNCVVVDSPKDSISGIMDTAKELANLFKYRAGCGVNLSSLRPEGCAVNNSAKSTTGAWSFAELYSHVVNMIGQNGRRGALMLTMEVSHPDIEKFITMKQDLQKVTGANISVMLSDKFMEAVNKDNDFVLEYKGEIYKTIKARELFNSIVRSAYATAEPGIVFWDKILHDNPMECYPEFHHIGLNPCQELCLSPYSSCRLISVNLSNFVGEAFDVKRASFSDLRFLTVVKKAQRLADDLIDLEIEKLDIIIAAVDEQDVKELFAKLKNDAIRGRRTGLGVHGLADCLLQLNLVYGTQEACQQTAQIGELLANAAYQSSAILAKERGSFPAYDAKLEHANVFLNRLSDVTKKKLQKHGRRNGALLTVAPTGTVSLVSRTSSGIEPIFQASYVRRKKLYADDCTAPDFIDETGQAWRNYGVLHPMIRQWQERDKTVFMPPALIVAAQVPPERRIAMQAALQSHIDHQISSTINLSAETTVEAVRDIYMQAYKQGCKGITIYRDGSRANVLVSGKNIERRKAKARPERVPCDVHHVTVRGEKWIVIVGKLENKAYEIFCGLADKIEIPRRYKDGYVLKHPRKATRSIYDLHLGVDDDELIIKDIINVFDNSTHGAFTRLLSLALRNGIPIQHVSEQLSKDEKDSDMFSFSKVVGRICKRYITDGTKSDRICPGCQQETLIYQGGCISCSVCSWSKCD